MFVIYSDISDRRRAVAEIRALSTPGRMRARLLREVDMLRGRDWRRTHVCNLFVCQEIDGGSYMNSIIEGIWETRQRRSFLRIIINVKSPPELAGDERRLALAMAFHPRLGDESPLGMMDLLLVLEHILWFAGPQLI